MRTRPSRGCSFAHELKNAKGLSRADGKLISDAVFAYYRWFGWLEKTDAITAQLERAVELDEAFQKNPSSMCRCRTWPRGSGMDFGADEGFAGMVAELQMKPALWLRARVGQGRDWRNGWANAGCGDGMLADAIRYEGAEDLFRTPEFHAGEFRIAGHQFANRRFGLCKPKPGETWWDACAGEGGKALHLCDLMRNKGLLWASDRAEWRLKKLKLRAARAKLFNYRAALVGRRRKAADKNKVRRHSCGCALQRDRHLATKSAGALDDHADRMWRN